MSELVPLVLIVVVLIAVAWLMTKDKSVPVPNNIMDPQAWEVGPIWDGVNVSSGMDLHPAACDGGWCINIPVAGAGSLHYVTVPTASLTGKTKLTMVCELVMAEGVKLCPVKSPDAPSLLTLYFQRRGDNWTAQGEYETYRWFASLATETNLSAREYTIEVGFNEYWTALISSTIVTQREAYNDALANAGRIGFVLGGGDGLGHGVYATGPAKLVVKSFKVE